MADTFTPVICFGEDCDGLEFTDITGIFSLEKPLGYNAPSLPVPTLNTSTGTFGYTSYTLELWYAQTGGIDSTEDPDLTVDLLTKAHTTDATTGYVTWDFSLDDLGISTIMSGWWLGKVTAVWVDADDEEYTYTATAMMFLTRDITQKVDVKMAPYDPDCACADGCIVPPDLFLKLQMAKADACLTYVDAAQRNMDWLYANYSLCSC